MSKTKKTLIILSGIVLLLVGLVAVALWRLRSAIHAVSAYDVQSDRKISLNESNRAVKDMLDVKKNEFDKVVARIVAADGTVEFIETIESLARSMGVAVLVETVTVDNGTRGGDFQDLNLIIKTQGTWDANYRFAKALEVMPYKINVSRLELKHETLSSGSTQSTTWVGLVSVSVVQYK